jgi:tungstate transport system substrate-binding protein
MALKQRILLGFVLLSAMLAIPPEASPQKYITVSSTTSTENSGLFKHILPLFKQKSGIDVRVVAQGTGQALDMGKRGDSAKSLL